MSYSKTTIIKLQQNETNSNVHHNGTYDIELQQPLILDDGDVVQLKSAFLDTTASSSGKIIIENDLPVSISMAKYLQNFNKDQDLKTYYPARAGDAKTDNKLYFLCNTFTNHATIKRLKSITIRPHDKKQRIWGSEDRHHNTILKFEYTANSGQPTPFSISVPRSTTFGINSVVKLIYLEQNAVDPNNAFDKSFGNSSPTFRGATFRYVGGQDILKRNNISPSIEIDEVDIGAPGAATLEMRHQTIEFTIPKGSYLPNELAIFINEKLVQIDYFGGQIGNDDGQGIFPVSSPTLATLQQLKADMFNNENQVQMNFCREDGASVMSFEGDLTGANDRFVGANQISLEFDSDLQKLNWSIIHFPIYVGDGTSASAGAVFEANGVATKYSGLFFTDLSPASFWYDTLGFQHSIIQGAGVAGNGINVGGQLTNLAKLFSDAEDGVNMTGALKSIDLPIRKTTDYAKVEGSTDIETTTNFTTPIYSSKIFQDPQAKSGYFLLEIDGLPNSQDFRGSNNSLNNSNSNKIQGIITRYYTTESFTMDEGQGGINYTHSGASAVVSNLRVSIKDHNGNIPEDGDLGDRNTIFLEVIKARNVELERDDMLDYSNS